MLELGSGFSFLGQQYHIKVGEKDYYLDLLFYHVKLHCFFIVELKIDDFKPEHAGKLEFYITSIDENIKSPEDNPTIGLLLCKTVDKIVVEYTLKSKAKAIGVSAYRHSLPDDLKKELPDVEILRQQLKKQIIMYPNSIDEKAKTLKGLIQRLNSGKLELEKTDATVCTVIKKVADPLIQLIDLKLSEIKTEFKNTKIQLFYNAQLPVDYIIGSDITSVIKLENIWMFGFEITLNGFERGGKNAFDSWYKFEINFDKYKFILGPQRNNIWEEKAYNELFSKEELDVIADRFIEAIIDDINGRVEFLLAI